MDINQDLSGLDPASARTYLFDMTVHLKSLEAGLAQVRTDLALWASRVETARKAERADLVSAAEAELTRLQGKEAAFLADLNRARLDVDVLKDQLKNPAFASAELRDRADALLRDLTEITGEPDTVSPAVEALGADDALLALKRQMGLAPEAPAIPDAPSVPAAPAEPEAPALPDKPADAL